MAPFYVQEEMAVLVWVTISLTIVVSRPINRFCPFNIDLVLKDPEIKSNKQADFGHKNV